jgi:hypothetical protein
MELVIGIILASYYTFHTWNLGQTRSNFKTLCIIYSFAFGQDKL